MRVVVAARGNSVSLVIEDSGPGIPIEERAVLFDRFQRGNDGGEGAGLGLAIADAVVRSTGGRWRVADAPDGGAHMEVVWHRFRARDTVLEKERQSQDNVQSRRPQAARPQYVEPQYVEPQYVEPQYVEPQYVEEVT